MNSTPRFVMGLLAAALALAAAPATGQEFVEPDAPAAADVNNFFIDDSNFDQWVFGGQQNSTAARARFDSLLKVNIEELERICGLNEAQKKKLLLAGRGDVKRFLDQVEEKRKEFQAVRTDQNKFGQFYQTLRPLQTQYAAGLFGEGSFYAKSAKSTLEPEQAARYEAQMREKLVARYKARVELVAASLGNIAGLSAEQRRKFVALILEETKAPRSFGQNDYQVVILQASKLPEEKLKPLFDDRQWQTINQQFVQIRRLEENLKTGGYIPFDDPGPAAEAPPAPGQGLMVPGIRIMRVAPALAVPAEPAQPARPAAEAPPPPAEPARPAAELPAAPAPAQPKPPSEPKP